MKKIKTLQSGNFAENDWSEIYRAPSLHAGEFMDVDGVRFSTYMEMLKSVGEFHPNGGFFRLIERVTVCAQDRKFIRPPFSATHFTSHKDGVTHNGTFYSIQFWEELPVRVVLARRVKVRDYWTDSPIEVLGETLSLTTSIGRALQ